SRERNQTRYRTQPGRRPAQHPCLARRRSAPTQRLRYRSRHGAAAGHQGTNRTLQHTRAPARTVRACSRAKPSRRQRRHGRNRHSISDRHMNLEVVIVDDERIGRQRLRRLLAKEPEVEVVAECADGSTAVEAVKEHAPDLLFLDIQMPGLDGFQVVDFIAPIAQPAIVFVTAFDKHAVHAFETCAVDYLLKPVEPARLAKTLQRVRAYLTASPPPMAARISTSATAPTQRFTVRSGQRTSFVAPEQIDW